MTNSLRDSPQINTPEDVMQQMSAALALAKTKAAIEVCSQLGYQLLDEHFGANSLTAAPFNTRWTQAVTQKTLTLSK